MQHVKAIEVKQQMTFHYDGNSEAFKGALHSYRALVWEGATVEDVLNEVAKFLVKNGAYQMIPGLGVVGLVGYGKPKHDYCGIMVETSIYGNPQVAVSDSTLTKLKGE